MRPLKFNKCPSNLKRESKRTYDQHPTSITCVTRLIREGREARGTGTRDRWWGREGDSDRTFREWGITASRGFGSLRPESAGVGCTRDSGFSRGRLSGASVCADRLRSRRVRCPDSLCHSWHTKNTRVTVLVFTRGAVPRVDITYEYSSARIRALVLARVPPRHTAQPSGK